MSDRDKGEDDAKAAPRKTPKCPICGKPRSAEYRPFCSKRCADVDLGRWLKGDYAIPVMDDDDEDGDEAGIAPGQPPQSDDWNDASR